MFLVVAVSILLCLGIAILKLIDGFRKETNEIACLQGPPGLVEETDVKSETRGGSSKSIAGGEELSLGGSGKTSEEGTSEPHLEI